MYIIHGKAVIMYETTFDFVHDQNYQQCSSFLFVRERLKPLKIICILTKDLHLKMRSFKDDVQQV